MAENLTCVDLNQNLGQKRKRSTRQMMAVDRKSKVKLYTNQKRWLLLKIRKILPIYQSTCWPLFFFPLKKTPHCNRLFLCHARLCESASACACLWMFVGVCLGEYVMRFYVRVCVYKHVFCPRSHEEASIAIPCKLQVSVYQRLQQIRNIANHEKWRNKMTQLRVKSSSVRLYWPACVVSFAKTKAGC